MVGSPGSAAAAGDGLEIRVLSNRADLVSGGDALVRVVPPSTVDPSTLAMTLGGRDVTERFAVRANGHYEALLQGLPLGRSVLRARAPNGSGARITITNHPADLVR